MGRKVYRQGDIVFLEEARSLRLIRRLLDERRFDELWDECVYIRPPSWQSLSIHVIIGC